MIKQMHHLRWQELMITNNACIITMLASHIVNRFISTLFYLFISTFYLISTMLQSTLCTVGFRINAHASAHARV